LGHALTNSKISYPQAAALVQFYSRLGPEHWDQLEAGLQKMVDLEPDQPESHYDLASIQVVRGKTKEALEQLRIALDLNAKRLKADPTARDLAATNRVDPRFDALRSSPEFQKITAPK
ncbi:MAG TPA: hypothetical protein VN516_01215, partial [Candidatus Baltobacteraceae bacterium]|nr:hypothetical protein [Candidatus Baltobacteraceae bacterium]